MNTVLIGVGSNINPQENIARAKSILSGDHHFIAESIFQTTDPIGLKDQPPFLNGAFLVETHIPRDAFDQYLKETEKALGRNLQALKSGPRTIDLDIIVWNEKIIHKDFYQRDFVRKAALELLPDLSYDTSLFVNS